MKDSSDLASLMYALALAALGFDEGLDVILNNRVMTNSNIESFLVKTSLLLLNKPISKNLLGSKSVFLNLEKLFDECYSVSLKNRE